MDGKNILEVNETSQLAQDDVIIIGCGESLQKIKCKNFKVKSPGVLKINGQEYDGSSDMSVNISNDVVVISGSNPNITLDPNKMYSLSEITSLSYTLGGNDVLNSIYTFTFVSGDTPTVLTRPKGITANLTVKANATYVITIKNNVLSYTEMEF